jgi:putative tricarboxylic transport membrane protein
VRRNLSSETGAAIFFLLVGVVFTIGALQIPSATSEASIIGPRVFPLVVGILMMASSALMLVRSLRRPAEEHVPAAANPVAAGTPPAATGSQHHPNATAEHHIADDMVGHSLYDVPFAEAHALAETKSEGRRIVVILAFLAAYIVAFIPLGYPLSTFLFIGGITVYLNRAKLVRNLVYAAVFAVVVFLLFNYVLGVSLPLGGGGFE